MYDLPALPHAANPRRLPSFGGCTYAVLNLRLFRLLEHVVGGLNVTAADLKDGIVRLVRYPREDVQQQVLPELLNTCQIGRLVADWTTRRLSRPTIDARGSAFGLCLIGPSPLRTLGCNLRIRRHVKGYGFLTAGRAERDDRESGCVEMRAK